MRLTILALLCVVACTEEKTVTQVTVDPTTVPVTPKEATPPATHSYTFVNKCEETVWVGSVGNTGFSGMDGGGWEMTKGKSHTIAVPVGWGGRFWPRTGCTFDTSGNCPTTGAPCCASGSCLEADNKNFGLKCGFSGIPPASLVEVTLDAPSGNGPYDTYDTSFVDGWSVPLKVEPVAGTYNPTADPGIQAPWCLVSGCTSAPVCPDAYKVHDSKSSCWSPCQTAVRAGASDATKLCCSCNMQAACTCPDTCCAGNYGCTPYHDPMYPADMICDPWNKDTQRGWDDTAKSYITAVKAGCPEVYAWQFDDKAATFQCRKTAGLVNYTVTFCP